MSSWWIRDGTKNGLVLPVVGRLGLLFSFQSFVTAIPS